MRWTHLAHEVRVVRAPVREDDDDHGLDLGFRHLRVLQALDVRSQDLVELQTGAEGGRFSWVPPLWVWRCARRGAAGLDGVEAFLDRRGVRDMLKMRLGIEEIQFHSVAIVFDAASPQVSSLSQPDTLARLGQTYHLLTSPMSASFASAQSSTIDGESSTSSTRSYRPSVLNGSSTELARVTPAEPRLSGGAGPPTAGAGGGA